MRRHAGDRGATTVEFALVFPLFIGIVAVGAFFGWLAYMQSQVDRAAQRAARFAAVPTTAGAYDYCHASVLGQVNGDLATSSIAAAELEVGDLDASLPVGGPCTGEKPQRYVRVTISHAFSNPFTPVVSLLTPLSGTFTLQGSAQARVETS